MTDDLVAGIAAVGAAVGSALTVLASRLLPGAGRLLGSGKQAKPEIDVAAELAAIRREIGVVAGDVRQLRTLAAVTGRLVDVTERQSDAIGRLAAQSHEVVIRVDALVDVLRGRA